MPICRYPGSCRPTHMTVSCGRQGLDPCPPSRYTHIPARTLFWGMKVPRPDSTATRAISPMARGSDDSSFVSRRQASFRGLTSTGFATAADAPDIKPTVGVDVDGASSTSLGFGAWKTPSWDGTMPFLSLSVAVPPLPGLPPGKQQTVRTS